MIKTFDFETDEYRAYISANPQAKLHRYPTKLVVFTGADIPPEDLDERYCEIGIDGLRESLLTDHGVDRVNAWLGKYL